jgi:hypothetical protein
MNLPRGMLPKGIGQMACQTAVIGAVRTVRTEEEIADPAVREIDQRIPRLRMFVRDNLPYQKGWCGRRDLNPHGLSATRS